MAEALTFEDLLRFHREVLMPEFAAVRNDFRGEIGGVEERLRGEIGGVEGRLRGEIGGVEDRLRGEIGGVEERLRGEIGGLEERLHDEILSARVDFARQLLAQTETFQSEIRSFRGDFDAFRDDAIRHFDAIYDRLETGAFELQALKAAVVRLERQNPPSVS